MSKRAASLKPLRKLNNAANKVARSSVPDVKEQGISEAAGPGAMVKALAKAVPASAIEAKKAAEQKKKEYDYQNIDPEKIILQVHKDDQGRLLQDVVPLSATGKPIQGKDKKHIPVRGVFSCVTLAGACTAGNGNYGSQYCSLDKKTEAKFWVTMAFGMPASDTFHKYVMSKEEFFEHQKDALAWMAKLQRTIHNLQLDEATRPASLYPTLCEDRILASRKKAVDIIANRLKMTEEEKESYKLEDLEDYFFEQGKAEEYREVLRAQDNKMFVGKMKKLPVPPDFDIKLEEERKAKAEGRPYTPVFGDEPILVRASFRIYPKERSDKNKSASENKTETTGDSNANIFQIDDYTPPKGHIRRQVPVYGNQKDRKTGQWNRIEKKDETEELLPALSVGRPDLLFRASQYGMSILLLSFQRLELGTGFVGRNPYIDDDEFVNEENMDAYNREIERMRREQEEAEKAKSLASGLDAALDGFGTPQGDEQGGGGAEGNGGPDDHSPEFD